MQKIRKWQLLSSLPASLYTASQLRTIDASIIDKGTAGSVLMLRAARATFTALQDYWPNLSALWVFCGSGNNGGDGFLIAMLAAQRGIRVTVVELVDPARQSEDAATARNQLLACGVQPIPFSEFDPAQMRQSKDDNSCIVDALLGIGLKGEPRANYKKAIELILYSEMPVVAVDIPSGLDSDSGQVANGCAVCADLTVSFIGLKRGMFTGDAAQHTGDVIYSDLDAGATISQSEEAKKPAARLLQLDYCKAGLPQRSATAYKNTSGHVLVVGGDVGMAGAALLSASAALRCGAGLVSVATRSAHVAAFVGRQPELMARGVEQGEELQSLLERASVLVIGPGLGQSEWSAQMLRLGLQYAEQKRLPVVIDADALNTIAKQPSLLSPQLAAVITPHVGEARRLVGEQHKLIGGNRFDMLEALCKKYQQVTVLKGAGTLVGSENGVVVNPYGNAVLATAGTGDVLSGVIAALLAQGLERKSAAQMAVLLHAAAADTWQADQGNYGMLASDLLHLLPALCNQLSTSSAT